MDFTKESKIQLKPKDIYPQKGFAKNMSVGDGDDWAFNAAVKGAQRIHPMTKEKERKIR